MVGWQTLLSGANAPQLQQLSNAPPQDLNARPGPSPQYLDLGDPPQSACWTRNTASRGEIERFTCGFNLTVEGSQLGALLWVMFFLPRREVGTLEGKLET